MSPSPSADEANPSSPQDTTPKAPTTSPLFLPPRGQAVRLAPPSPSSSTSDPSPSSNPSPAAAEESTSSAGYADSATPLPQPDSSDTPSTGGNPGRITKAGLRVILGQAVKTVTNGLAVFAANTTEQEFGLWRADDDDIEGMSAPVSGIVWRKVPAEARDSDAIDIIGLSLAVAVYIGKNLKLKSAIRAGVASGEIAPAAAVQRPPEGP